MLHKIMPLSIRYLAITLLLSPFQLLQAETVTVPIKIDFPLLQQLVVTQLFTGKSNSTELLNDDSGCSEIVLSEPKLSESNQHLRIDSRLSAKLGVKLLDQCVSLVPWEGYIKIISDPIIKTDNPRQIHLKVVDSQLITLDNEPLTSGALWDQARKYIHPLVDQFHMDLTPSIDELKSFLPAFLSSHSQTQINNLLTSLRLTDIQVTNEGIQSNIALEIETVAQVKNPEKILTEQEQLEWQKKWQSMDALLTYTIKYYAKETDLQELKLTLFDILLDARYQLQYALQEDSTADDPIRHWFINSWAQLVPVLKKISLESPKHAPLAFMTLVTSADALQVLDQLGPTFGLDISIDGLRRLARIINKTPHVDPLKYNKSQDPELLKLFQFNLSSNTNSNQSNLSLWPISSAVAATSPALNSWVPATEDLNVYLPKVRSLLLSSANQSLKKSKLSPQQKDIFKKMVMTTAWQESCWRQYKVKQNKIVPLSSSTGDTGIMQINEKVWRGFVDRQKLRWDIAYNAQTGSDILLKYMTRYAIKKAEDKQPGGLDNLARSTYSTYNGGPRQVSRYRNNNAPSALKKVDAVFYEKYLKVKQGKELSVGPECLGQSATTKTINTNQPQKKIASPIKKTQRNATLTHNRSWINKQKKNYFTLQLGVFSSTKAANIFILNRKVIGNYAIYQQKNTKKVQYGVVYGYYSTREKAKKESLRFKQIKPWIRSFQDIRK